MVLVWFMLGILTGALIFLVAWLFAPESETTAMWKAGQRNREEQILIKWEEANTTQRLQLMALENIGEHLGTLLQDRQKERV